MKKKLASFIIQPTTISQRIISLTLDSNPKITVISAYAPTENVDNNEKEHFYSDLSNYLQSLPLHNLVVILGDFNAKI